MKFLSIVLKVAGIEVVKKELSAIGIWRMTYIDDDLRILYAKGGKNVLKENVYILKKVA